LDLKIGKVPALADTGAQFSCVRSDVIEYLYLRGEAYTFFPCTLPCFLPDGSKAQVNDAMRLHVRLLSFSWDYEFKVLNDGPFPAIIGMDFLQRTQMRFDISSRTYSFAFVPDVVGSFFALELQEGSVLYLQRLCGEVVDFNAVEPSYPSDLDPDVLMKEFPSLFSVSLGIAKCVPYDIELSDTTPVRSPPYR
jgi:hypothetical protein